VSFLDQVIRRWGIHNRVSGITTDQDSNTKKGVALYSEQIAPIAWIPCASHKIQLCINNALKRQTSAFAIFQKCKDICTVFAGSSTATEILHSHQRKHFEGKEWELLTFNKTRWNSWFTMSARVHKLMPAIESSLDDLDSGPRDLKEKAKELHEAILRDDEVDALGEMLTLLQPAADFTHWAGHAARPTLSQVYGRVYSLLPALESLTTPQAKALHRSLDSQIKESWPLTDIPDAILLAIYFNSVCASSDFLLFTEVNGESLLNRAKLLVSNLIIETMRLRHEESQRTNPDPLINGSVDAVLKAGYQGTAYLAIRFYTVYCQSKDNMKKFLDCPQDFWLQQHTTCLQEVVSIALSYLCIQATSSDSERAFSRAGLILDKNRASTADDIFQAVIFAQSFASIVPQIVRIYSEEEGARLEPRRKMVRLSIADNHPL